MYLGASVVNLDEISYMCSTLAASPVATTISVAISPMFPLKSLGLIMIVKGFSVKNGKR